MRISVSFPQTVNKAVVDMFTRYFAFPRCRKELSPIQAINGRAVVTVSKKRGHK